MWPYEVHLFIAWNHRESFPILSWVCSAKAGLDARAGGRQPPLPQLPHNLDISLCCLFRKDGLGLVGKSSLATITSHKSYLCVLKEFINIGWDAILFFRITKCYWKLRFGQVTTFWICQTLCFANRVGFLEPLLVGSSAELAVTSQGLSNRMCSPNICSLNDLTLCLHFHDF